MASTSFELILPLVRREWRNGSNSSYNCTSFLHSLLTKGKLWPCSVSRIEMGATERPHMGHGLS